MPYPYGRPPYATAPLSEAQRVAREIARNLWYSLGLLKSEDEVVQVEAEIAARIAPYIERAEKAEDRACSMNEAREGLLAVREKLTKQRDAAEAALRETQLRLHVELKHSPKWAWDVCTMPGCADGTAVLAAADAREKGGA